MAAWCYPACCALDEIGMMAVEHGIKIIDDLDLLLDEQVVALSMMADVLASLPQSVKIALVKRLKVINAATAQEIQQIQTEALLVATETESIRNAVRHIRHAEDQAAVLAALATMETRGPSRKTLAEDSALPLLQHIETCFDWKDAALSPKTQESYRTTLALLGDVVGDKPLRDIDQKDVLVFLDRLLVADGAKHGKSRLDRDTLVKHLSHVKSFFTWAESTNRVYENPASKVQAPPERTVEEPPRLAFSKVQLERIFDAPLFVGCQSKNRIHRPGPYLCRDARFWYPLVALLTGARLGEIEQLLVRDVQTRGPNNEFTVLSVKTTYRDAISGEKEIGKQKTVKTKPSIRLLPIHPMMKRLGFMDYVESMKIHGIDAPLFPANRFGRTFNEFFLEHIGITGEQYSFHSFRHSYKAFIRSSPLKVEIENRLMGHRPKDSGEWYAREIDDGELALYYQFVNTDLSKPVDLTHLIDFRPR